MPLDDPTLLFINAGTYRRTDGRTDGRTGLRMRSILRVWKGLFTEWNVIGNPNKMKSHEMNFSCLLTCLLVFDWI